ncbi:ISL3 family transposase [Streptomyces sp. NPDC053427]|uniref:ISL3 family transposase n=1 Tax=Streptomyces sp. NPDC053427 TaxID=3365701 RepID=UPI0037D08400
MEEKVLRLEELLFPAVADVAVLSVDVSGDAVQIEARRTTAGSACPGCGRWSSRVHSSYLRFPADVPSAGRRVVLCLRVRRFACPLASCARRTFVEQVPGLTRRYSQWTERLRSTLAAVGLALAGRAGARMAGAFGVSVSRSTVLRMVDALPEPEVPAPRVVGVDEYATRKGRNYGTVLVDVETRRPVDLLPDREASSLAAWLATRPGVEVVCRDRAAFFADGAATGAPQAVQVADRWHLWHNLSEAAERCVADHRGCLRADEPEPPQQILEPGEPADDAGSPWLRSHRFADRTRDRHAAVHALLAAGHSRRSIERQLGMTYRTVKRLADAAPPKTSSAASGRAARPSSTSTRPTWMTAGTRAAPMPGRHGRRSCCSATPAAISEFAPTAAPSASRQTPVTAPPPSPRTVAGWILRRPDALTEVEQLRLKAVLVHCPELDALTGHVRSFARMLTERQGELLPQWLDAVRQDALPGLHTLAAAIDRDRDAVIAGLALPWNSGVVEGHVNRIEMLKRQMFGRAGFQLLRKRVLLS